MKAYVLPLPLAILISILAASSVHAQDRMPIDDPDPQSAKTEFDRRFAEWKGVIRGIEELRIQYQTADTSTREALQRQLQENFEVANAMIPGLVEAAKTAFQAAPKANQQITSFLRGVAAYDMVSDNYDDAFPIIQMLLTQDPKHDWLHAWIGIIAVIQADYDLAKEHLDPLAKSGFFDLPPESNDRAEMNLWNIGAKFHKIFDAHRKAWETERSIRDVEAKADDLPRVLLKTNKGEIVVELYENEAPNTVKNFMTLVDQGFYNGLTFHRVLPNFMAQTGCPAGNGLEGPGYSIPCECQQENARFHFRGSLGMAHSGRDTGGSQFYITFLPTPHLDGQHTVFGRVIEGMDVLAKIRKRNPDSLPENSPSPQPDALPVPDKILEAKVIRKRPETDYSQFNKIPKE